MEIRQKQEERLRSRASESRANENGLLTLTYAERVHVTSFVQVIPIPAGCVNQDVRLFEYDRPLS